MQTPDKKCHYPALILMKTKLPSGSYHALRKEEVEWIPLKDTGG